MKCKSLDANNVVKENSKKMNDPYSLDKENNPFKRIYVYLKRLIISLFLIGAVSLTVFISINLYVMSYSSKYILDSESVPKTDCVLILGAGVFKNGELSDMLYDRVKKAAYVSKSTGIEKFLVSGDHGRKSYDEVNSILNVLEEDFNIDKKNIFLDHAGFSTYDSMYRADYIFKVKSTVIFTQKYHLYRSIYNARKKGIEAYGVASDRETSYFGMSYYKMRESIAIVKDFFYSLFNFDPTFKGPSIPITGDGIPTHDK